MDAEQTPYISCIRIGRQSIMPPLLDDERRTEMRYYRDLAVARENRVKMKRNSIDSGVMISSTDGTCIKKVVTPVEPLTPNGEKSIVDANIEEYSISPDTCYVEDNVFTENDYIGLEPKIDFARRSSYTLENPSPVLMEYLKSSLNADKKRALFINPKEKTENNLMNVPAEEVGTNVIQNGAELTLEDLNLDEDDHSPSEFNEPTTNLSLITSTNPTPVINSSDVTTSLHLDEYSRLETSNHSRNILDLDDSLNCTGNSEGNISNENSPRMQETRSFRRSVSGDDPTHQLVNDSFSRDIRQLDFGASYESDTCQESRYSDCSSVSLSKFLSQDKNETDHLEAEYAAFNYIEEMLKTKHANELKKLLDDQRKESEDLKAHFARISSVSKSTPSPKSGYERSNDELKTYSAARTPVSRQSLSSEFSRNDTSTPKMLNESNKIRQNVYSLPKKTRQKLHALIVGHLTRQLMKTENVTRLVQTIKDCLVTAVSLQNESNLNLSELDLQSRLLQQLTGACNELHEIFELPAEKRVAMIAADREKKNRLSLKKNTTPLPLSEATKRTLQRRNTTKSSSPAKQQYIKKRCRSLSSASSEPNSRRSTPSRGRQHVPTVLTQKYSLSQRNALPWR